MVADLLCCALLAATVGAEPPPKNLLKEVAANGSLFEKERERYSYRQSFKFFEIDRSGRAGGHYQEVRDIIFGPDGERTERFLKKPVNALKRIKMTDEDFRDIREMQPFILTDDTLWFYERRYRGEEMVDGRRCWVFRIQPRQVLEGQRLLDGQVWIDQETRQAVRVSGLPLPQIHHNDQDNLFARFTTIYELVDGEYWFPVKTFADDILPFSSGGQRVRYEIDFADYKRFTAETTVTFESIKPGSEPAP